MTSNGNSSQYIYVIFQIKFLMLLKSLERFFALCFKNDNNNNVEPYQNGWLWWYSSWWFLKFYNRQSTWRIGSSYSEPFEKSFSMQMPWSFIKPRTRLGSSSVQSEASYYISRSVAFPDFSPRLSNLDAEIHQHLPTTPISLKTCSRHWLPCQVPKS